MVGGKRLAVGLGALSLSVGGWGLGGPSAHGAPGDNKDAQLSWNFTFTSVNEQTGAAGPTVTCTIRASVLLTDYIGSGQVYVDDPDPGCQPKNAGSRLSNAVTRATISYEDRHGNPSEATALGF